MDCSPPWSSLHSISQAKILAAVAAKLHQLCLTLCDPIDGSPPGSSTPGILQARILEWVAISFSSAWKWKVTSLSHVWLFSTHGLQPARLLHPWDFPGRSTGVGCHCLFQWILPTQNLTHTCYIAGGLFSTVLPRKPSLAECIVFWRKC